MQIEVDAPVLLFSLSVAVATSLIFGSVPSLVASRVDLNDALKEGAKGSGGGSRLRGALVVAEVALCLMLLVGAGLMMQSFIRLHRVDTGFSTENLLVARVTNFRPGTRAEKAAALSQFHERVLARLGELPGVVSAGATNSLPFASVQNERSKVDLKVKGRADEEIKHTAALAGADVSNDYFEAMRIPLKRGRLFDSRDTIDSQMVLVVNERAAEALWPDRDPIGQQLLWGALTSENPYCTVVGVVGNVKHQAAEGDNGIELYYPYTQYPVTNVYYVIRTQGNPLSLAEAVRQVINDTDKNAAIVFMKMMDEIINDSLWQRRLWGVMFAIFALLALILAAIGIYGVLSYSISQRTREIGIRMALGARMSDVSRMVIGQGLRLVIIGVFIGLLGSLALTRVVASLLFGVSATDPLTFAGVALLLALVALVACFIPARRAAKTDPVIALRAE
jgi:putative ABC transport system permease protein